MTFHSKPHPDGTPVRLVVLLLIATNAVLIQTLVDEESPTKNLVRVIVIGIAALSIVYYRLHLHPGLVILGLACLILYALTGNPDQLTLLFVLLVAPLFVSFDRRKMDRIFLVAAIASPGLVFAFLGLGLTQNEVLVSSTQFVIERERANFGTNGVPFFMNLIYGATAFAIYYCYRWQLRARAVVAVAAIAWMGYLYTQTDGRGGALALVVFILLAMSGRWVFPTALGKTALAATPAIFLAVAILIASAKDNLRLNEFLSYRPTLYADFLATLEPFSYLIGSSVKQSSVGSVDNSYIHLLVGLGLPIFLVVCIVFARAVLNLTRRGHYLEVAFVLSTMIYGVSESILLRVENVFVLYTWCVLLRESSASDLVAAEVGVRTTTSTDYGSTSYRLQR